MTTGELYEEKQRKIARVREMRQEAWNAARDRARGAEGVPAQFHTKETLVEIAFQKGRARAFEEIIALLESGKI
jgi:hypothetical protein